MIQYACVLTVRNLGAAESNAYEGTEPHWRWWTSLHDLLQTKTRTWTLQASLDYWGCSAYFLCHSSIRLELAVCWRLTVPVCHNF